MEKIKLGLIINPVAGMGGSVGLKGTDGKVKEALERGAVPKANERAKLALSEIVPIKDKIVVLTNKGSMGEDAAVSLGFCVEALNDKSDEYTSFDTIELAKRIKEKGAKLLLFVGGDGTARDVYKAVGTKMVSLGVPAGVKIHSPVYAKNPKTAGALAKLYLNDEENHTKELEVLDIDEELYRNNVLSTSLFGYLTVPFKKIYTQNRKSPTPITEKNAIRSIGMKIISQMEDDTYYLIGAGTTTRGIMEELGLPYTLIGVDIIKDKKLVAKDLYGKQIMEVIKGKKAKMVLTITGGQGFLFGRGNQQITPQVIKEVGKENIIIVATGEKMMQLMGEPILVDTGDVELDHRLEGYYRVISGYHEAVVAKVAVPGD